MEYKIEFDPNEDMILARVKGKIEYYELKELIVETFLLAKQSHCTNTLTDLSEAKLIIKMTEAYALPEFIAKVIADHGMNIIRFKRAFVGTKDQDLFQFYETVAYNRGMYTRLFYSFDEALEWLRENKNPHEKDVE